MPRINEKAGQIFIFGLRAEKCTRFLIFHSSNGVTHFARSQNHLKKKFSTKHFKSLSTGFRRNKCRQHILSAECCRPIAVGKVSFGQIKSIKLAK